MIREFIYLRGSNGVREAELRGQLRGFREALLLTKQLTEDRFRDVRRGPPRSVGDDYQRQQCSIGGFSEPIKLKRLGKVRYTDFCEAWTGSQPLLEHSLRITAS